MSLFARKKKLLYIPGANIIDEILSIDEETENFSQETLRQPKLKLFWGWRTSNQRQKFAKTSFGWNNISRRTVQWGKSVQTKYNKLISKNFIPKKYALKPLQKQRS